MQMCKRPRKTKQTVWAHTARVDLHETRGGMYTVGAYGWADGEAPRWCLQVLPQHNGRSPQATSATYPTTSSVAAASAAASRGRS